MFYSCRLTAAATLAVSLAKREEYPISCDTVLPYFMPPGLPRFPTLTHMCTSRMRFRKNMGCEYFRGRELRCGHTSRPDIRPLVAYCLGRCTCGLETRRNYYLYTEEIEYPKDVTASANPRLTSFGDSVEGGASYSGNPNPSPQYECAKTCTGVNHGCPLFSAGFCKCYAPPATAEFWHTGNCGLVPHIGFPVHTVTGPHGRRSYNLDLAQQRHSYYLNATAHFASLNGATAIPGPPPELHVQLASGMLPSPCNASYVSFTCGDSPDGIVHEPPENWLGALLPEGAKELPPVPKEFLKIRKL